MPYSKAVEDAAKAGIVKLIPECSDKEEKEIEYEDKSHKLDKHRKWIDDLLKTKGKQIVNFRQYILRTQHQRTKLSIPMSYADALIIYIHATKTVNPSGEINEEYEKIGAEIWYLGERLHRAPTKEEKDAVAADWCRLHAEGCRDHFIHEYEFIVKQNKETYEHILRELDNLNTSIS